MKTEGMSRRIPRRDRERDFEQQRLGAVEAAFDRLKAQVVRDLLIIDQDGKALTGRKANQYEDASGIVVNELFPQGARILNIGDPWQVLDKEGVVNLEYETGEEADFTYNKEVFIESVISELQVMIGRAESIRLEDSIFAEELTWRINAVMKHVERGIKIEDYPREAKILYDITRQISEHHGNDDGRELSREIWYAAMRLARGFEDSYYVEKVIQPTVEKENLQRKGLSEEDQKLLIRRLIEEFRGKKKYKHAELVKGAFPDTLFADESFDRVIASWSISAHMFGVMNEWQFAVVWKELDRLLKRDGVAYIWPLNYYSGSGDEMAASLRDHRARGGDVGYISSDSFEVQVEWLDDLEDDALAGKLVSARTLIFLPVGAKNDARRRVEGALQQMVFED